MTFLLPPVANAGELPSPALLLFHERIEENLQRMIRLAGGPDRLRPHVKTHKLPGLVRRQVGLGITRFKCATVAEAEMTASAGAPDVLLASQPVGPTPRRLMELIRRFPATRFSTIVDDAGVVRVLSAAASGAGVSLPVFLDLDVGQQRTGIAPGPAAAELYASIHRTAGLTAAGFHVYDGHLHQVDVAERAAACDAAFAPVTRLQRELVAANLPVPVVIAGGTPTFPMHARRAGVECSPGTCVLWDAGYATKLPDLDFLPAAVLLTRVVSRPGHNRLCLDLGHKAVASEMSQPRAIFPSLPGAVPVAHNEEHLVLETPRAPEFQVGDVLFAIPWHVCPTVALHSEVWIVNEGRAGESWPVVARARRITV